MSFVFKKENLEVIAYEDGWPRVFSDKLNGILIEFAEDHWCDITFTSPKPLGKKYMEEFLQSQDCVLLEPVSTYEERKDEEPYVYEASWDNAEVAQ